MIKWVIAMIKWVIAMIKVVTVMIKWIRRELAISPYFIGIAFSEKDFHRELKKHNIPKTDWPEFTKNAHSHAAVHEFKLDRDGLCLIVCIVPNKKRKMTEVVGLLVHEAVHVWQHIRENIGETFPSSEFEAYAVQSISQQLVAAYPKNMWSL